MPTTTDFLAGVLGDTNYEPQRSNNAWLIFTGLGQKLGISGAEETLKLALGSFPLPKRETSPSMIPYLNEVRKFAGQTMFGDMTVTFHDYVDRGVASIIHRWANIIHDPRTGVRGLKSQYACNGLIEVFAPNGTSVITYTVLNAWPSTQDFGEIEMGNDEPVRIAVTFTCDKIYPADDSGLNLGAAAAVPSSL